MSFRDIQFNWLEEVIVPSIDLLYSTPKDRDLIQRDANERTVVANIYCKANAILYEKQTINNDLDNLGIDIEYNRNSANPKRVYEKCGICPNEGCFIKVSNLQHTVSSPDMIIHQRGSNENNQVVIEYKKASNINPQERDADKAKLIYFTCQQPFQDHENENYQYRIGFFIDLDLATYSVTNYQDADYGVPRIRQGGVWL
ncbi:MAG: hypothetical protein ABFD53_08630 [Anaerolineaceae bacterium]